MSLDLSDAHKRACARVCVRDNNWRTCGCLSDKSPYIKYIKTKLVFVSKE